MTRWLHLSDLHFSYNNHINKNIKDSLIEYLTKLGKFDFVLITGDIAYQGSYSEDLKEYITKISESTNCEIKNFYACIGNHDFNRNSFRTASVEIALKEYNKSNQQLSSDNYDYLVSTGHKLFNDKIKELLPHMSDFREVHNFKNEEEYTLTILNTCLFSHSNDDKDNLYILDNKFYDALAESKASREGNKINIAIGHHSCDWLNEKQQKEFCHYLSDKNVDLYLCGHNHDFDMEVLKDTEVHQFTTGSIFSKEAEKTCFLIGEFEPNEMRYSMELHSYSASNNYWDIDTNSNRKFTSGKFSTILPRKNRTLIASALTHSSTVGVKKNIFEFESEIKKKSKEFIGYTDELDKVKKDIESIIEDPDNGNYLFYHARELYGKSYFCAKLVYDLCFNSHLKELELTDEGIIFVDGKRANSITRAIDIIREQASIIVGYPIDLESAINEDKYEPVTDMEKIHKIIYELKKRNKRTLVIIDAVNEINNNDVRFLPEVIPSGICFLVTSNKDLKSKLFTKRNSRELKGFTEFEIKEILSCNNPTFEREALRKTKGCPMLIIDLADSLKEVDGDINNVNIRKSGEEYFDFKIKEWNSNPILAHLIDIFGVFGYITSLSLDQLQGYLELEPQFKNIKGTEILDALEKVKNQLLSDVTNDSKLFKLYYTLFIDKINERGTKKDLIECVKNAAKWMLENTQLFDYDVLGMFFVYWTRTIGENNSEFLIGILELLKDDKEVLSLEKVARSMFVDKNEINRNTFEFFEKYCEEIDSEKIYRLLLFAYSSSEKENALLFRLSSSHNHSWAKPILGMRLLKGEIIEYDNEAGEKLLREAVKEGNITAMNSLGWRLIDGDNVEQNKEEGEKLLREAVRRGNVEAMSNLGTRLIDGFNIEQDEVEGERILKEAILKGNIGAMNSLGIRLLDGENIEQNKEEGEKLLREAIVQGNVVTMNSLGIRLLDGENIEQNKEEGEKLLREAVKKGNAAAMNNLGIRLLDGENIEQNKEEGEKLLREAIVKGNAAAMNSLGIRLLDGENIEQNKEEGEKLLREAIVKGNAAAMNNLGIRLLDGENIEQNKEEGEKLLREAVKKGSVGAMNSLGIHLLDGENIEQNKEEGEKLLRETIKKGNLGAMYNLGIRLLDGENIEQNKEEGEKLLREAVKKGNLVAMYNLGIRLLDGENIEQNKEEGEKLLREAVKKGNLGAMYNLGIRLLDGDNIEQNKEEGEKVLREAAKKGNVEAMNNLGIRLIDGDNIEQNKEKGEKILRKAIEKGNVEAMANLAYSLYQSNRKEEAAYLFYRAVKIGDKQSEINLAYMIRKGEYISNNSSISVEKLLRKHVFKEIPDIIATINYALFITDLTEDNDKWLEAHDMLSKLGVYSKDELNDGAMWWIELANDGDIEGDLVIGWLSKLDLIDNVEDINYNDRFIKVLNTGRYIIDWLVQ